MKLIIPVLVIAFSFIDNFHIINSDYPSQKTIVNSSDKQEEAALLDSIIHLGQTTSVNRNRVDWKNIRTEMTSIHQQEGIIEATKYMLKKLEDFHGRIWKDNIPHNGLIKKWIPSNMETTEDIKQQYRKSNIPIHGTTINKKYGYINIPGIAMSDQDAENAHKIQQLIINAQRNNKIEGWIVDLRLNGGGTMFPMMTGLSGFFKDNQEIGSFIDRENDYKDRWIIKNNDFYFEDYQATDYQLPIIESTTALSTQPVVVLTSRWTSSSGEVVAIAFKNRPQTYFIGESTSGYTTAVSWNPLNDNMVLQLTTSYYADRLENIYKGVPVEPDLTIDGGDNFELIEKDKKVLEAIKWINQNLSNNQKN